MTINGISFNEPKFICRKCGCNALHYSFKESNNAMQARCKECNSWYGNIKYDNRTTEDIRRDKIREWLSTKEGKQ